MRNLLIIVALVVLPFISQPAMAQPEAVDLGLPSGIKWASCNLGASSPTDFGDYYAWGETSPKSDYSWSTLKYSDTRGDHFSKYVPSKQSSYWDYWSGSSSPDNKTKLDYSDDAARAKWGGSWRMPTVAEWEELRTNCTWIWDTEGVKSGGGGFRVKSKTNGNSIFLPAAGHKDGTLLIDLGTMGFYWSSSLKTEFPSCAYSVRFLFGYIYKSDYERCNGFSVRPVSE